MSQEDPQRTVQTFIDLVQRHEQSFYTFVHNVHSKGQGLFDSLMGWIELFLSYARSGLPQAVDLEFMLPAGGPEREKIMREVDAVAQYHYRLKVAHEEKIRRRFRREAAGEEEAALLDSVMASLSLGDTVLAEGGEMEEEESEEEDDGEDGMEESETSSIRSVEPGAIRVRGQAQLDGSGVSPRLGPTGSPMLRPQDGGSPRVGSSTSPGLSPVPPMSEKDRRGSTASNRSSLDKIRNTLRRSPDHDKEKDKEKEGEAASAAAAGGGGGGGGEEPPQWGGKHKKKHNVHPLHLQHHPPPPHGPHPHSHHHVQHPQTSPQPPPPPPHRTTPRTRKNRKDKKVQELMEHPETKAIAELRPLFVEMVSDEFADRSVCTSSPRILVAHGLAHGPRLQVMAGK